MDGVGEVLFDVTVVCAILFCTVLTGAIFAINHRV
jgi:hypothetical protein